MNGSLLDLGNWDAVLGVFFHLLFFIFYRSLPTISAIVGSQLSRHRNSLLALRQTTRPKFTVFTFFLHPHYKITNSIGKIDFRRMITARFNPAKRIRSRH